MPAETAVALISGPDKASDYFDEAPDYFFEGAEKLLEIWFGSAAENQCIEEGDKYDETDSLSLRSIPRGEWDKLLELAACRILHATSNEMMDSYVLSESSLFVSDRRIIIKTCGGTKLLATLERLMVLAKEYCGLDTIMNLYYSRKNFARPELQHPLYRNFDNEVNYLDRFFRLHDESEAYCLGSMKADRWYLYTYALPTNPNAYPDHTLEILMTEMPTNVLKIFTKDACKTGRECTVLSGIDKIMPKGTLIQEELFDPCGYSMNALVPNSDKYATIHVTPEPAFSYASFETNQDELCLFAQTSRVLQCFQPNKFLMTIFCNEHSDTAANLQRLWDINMHCYKRTNLQMVKLESEETVVYAQFVRTAIHSEESTTSSDEDDRDERGEEY